jgi:hypothetical protein
MAKTGKPKIYGTISLFIGILLIIYQVVLTPPTIVEAATISSNGGNVATAYPEGHRILSLMDGTLVTVFTSTTALWGNYLIYEAYSTDEGASWTSLSTGLYGKYPSFVRDNQNNLYLVYEQQILPSTSTIAFSKGAYSAGLRGPSYTWGSTVYVGSSLFGNDHYPALAADSQGNLHLVFDNHSTSSSDQVLWYYNMGSNWGAQWSGAANMTLNPYTSGSTSGSFPSIAVDTNNNLFVTWFNSNGTFYIRRAVYSGSSFKWDSKPWAAFYNIGSPQATVPNGMMMHSSLVKPGGGQIALVLPNVRNTTGYQYQLYLSSTAGSPSWTRVSGINGYTQGDGWPSIAGDSSGNYIIFLEDSSSGSSNIAYYKYLTNIGLSQKFNLSGPDNSGFPGTSLGVFNYGFPVIWTSGSASPYSVNYSFLSQLSLSLSIATYNRDGSPGNGTVNFGSLDPTGSPFLIGANQPAVQLTVSSDLNWNLTVQAGGDFAGNRGNTIPISQLQWRDHGSNNPWNAFQQMSQTIFSNQKPVSAFVLRHDLRLDINWLNAPDSYSAPLTYTVSPKL